jgi:hypothetical protein
MLSTARPLPSMLIRTPVDGDMPLEHVDCWDNTASGTYSLSEHMFLKQHPHKMGITHIQAPQVSTCQMRHFVVLFTAVDWCFNL